MPEGNIFEKINRSFGSWYEGLFGGTDDVRPKDILRRILVAVEDHRKEGVDGKIYVPNQYVLEIAVDDEEEKEYLLSFLDRDELETAVRRYCQQNHYNIRGALDFTIKEVPTEGDGTRREKVRVRCRYDSKLAATRPTPAPAAPQEPPEERTVADVAAEMDPEAGTVPAVAAATLSVTPPGQRPFDVAIARGSIAIGRSPRAGNDVVLADDGMVSRRHARIEMNADGSFTLYDLDTTNGTRVNGRRVDNRMLSHGDEIQVGGTRIVFHQIEDDEGAGTEARRADVRHTQGPGRPQVPPRPARLVLTDGVYDVDEFVLAQETEIGRGLTNDIVLPDRSVAAHHARVRRGETCTVEALDPEHATLVNDARVAPGAAVPLRDGDRLRLGSIVLRFQDERR